MPVARFAIEAKNRHNKNTMNDLARLLGVRWEKDDVKKLDDDDKPAVSPNVVITPLSAAINPAIFGIVCKAFTADVHSPDPEDIDIGIERDAILKGVKEAPPEITALYDFVKRGKDG